MINSVFGKTMENVKNRMQLYLTTDNEKAMKWFSKPTLKGSRYFKGLHLIETYKPEIDYNKPIYIGTNILDLSKLCMMDFHYNTIEKNFTNNYKLLYSDTDSLIYHIYHSDIYEWIKENKTLFDLSDSKREELKDDTNKKVYGKFKDELNSIPMSEFIALNPKVYSIKYKSNNEMVNKKTLKGVSKIVVKNEINHQDYINVLETNKQEKRKVMSFRSYNHEVFTVLTQKIALSSFYDKMQMIDSINNLPFGYKKENVI
jgi:hypothetical protein